jgi:ATP-dependent DNA helicase DinG
VPGKTLVLFTSLSLLRSTADELRVPLLSSGTTLLVQGEAGRAELLRRFRREPGGILLASVSFWEGVDVREHPIRNLVLTRLPFQPPDDPVISARSDRLKADGGEPFRDLFIPAAALKIKQGVGRLTRDRSAWAIVSVLDSRLRTERYGRLLMPAFGT